MKVSGSVVTVVIVAVATLVTVAVVEVLIFEEQNDDACFDRGGDLIIESIWFSPHFGKPRAFRLASRLPNTAVVQVRSKY